MTVLGFTSGLILICIVSGC